MKNRTLQKPVNWFASQIIQLVSTQYEFLLKGVSKQIIILTVCYYYVSDSNEIRTHNHLVRKRTLNHLTMLVKWLSYVVSTYLYGHL